MHHRTFLPLLFLLCLLSVTVSHLDAGEDVVVGKYLLDFGYSPENPAAASNTIISINLVDNALQENTHAENAWIRISKGEEIVFAGTFFVDNGNVSFSYQFPEAGVYTLTVRFSEAGETLAESTFSLSVEEADAVGVVDDYLVTGLVGVIILLVGIFAVMHFSGKWDRKVSK